MPHARSAKPMIFLITIMTTVLGSQASAQGEQSIETAQEFLQKISSLHRVGFRIDDPRLFRNDRTVAVMRPTKDRCVTSVHGEWDFEQYYEPNGSWYHITGPISENKIPWRRVSIVTQVGNSVRFVDRNRVIFITFPSEDIVKRAVFVMEYLRVHCDPTSGLAF